MRKYIITLSAMLTLTIAICLCIQIDAECKTNLDSEAALATKPFVPAVEKPEPKLYDPVEIVLIERVVASEARGESLIGQMAVCQTILDRSTLWGMTLTEVVTQPGQFASPYEGEISDLTREAVQAVLDGVRVWKEPVTHFVESSQTPYWATGKVVRGTIGGHTFYY